MTERLTPSPAHQTYRTALWQIALSRVEGDSLAGAMATAALTPLGVGDLTEALVVTVDAVVDAVVECADALDKNPACLAEAAFQGLHAQLEPPQRLPLFAASQVLLALDPTGEAGTRHEVCHPWPAQTPVESLADVAAGAILPLAVEAARQTHGLEDTPGLRLCLAVPEVLTQLIWAASGSDEARMRAALAAKAGR